MTTTDQAVGRVVSSDSVFPSSSSAWYAVGLICLIYVVSFADRLVLGILVEPIQAEMGISDTQMGFLNGFAFGLPYAVSAIIFSKLADRGNRKFLIICGVLLWSTCTVFSAYTTSFGTLTLCRMGVGVGEAMLSPTALSLIADLFNPKKRSFPISVFLATGLIGSNGAFIIGGATLGWLQNGDVSAFPIIRDMAPWRGVLFLVGLPGFVLAPILLATVREPERTGTIAASPYSSADVIAYLRKHGRFYGSFLFGMGMMQALTYSLAAWQPTVFIRMYEISAQQAGIGFGIAGFLGGFSGSIAIPAFAQKMTENGVTNPVGRAALYSIALAFPFVLSGLLAPTFILSLIILTPGIFFLVGSGALATLSIQAYAPNQMRAQITAIYLVGANVFGLASAPVIVAVISEQLPFANPLVWGIVIILCILTPISLFLLNRCKNFDTAELTIV